MVCPSCGNTIKQRNRVSRCNKCNAEITSPLKGGINYTPEEEYKVLYEDATIKISATISKEKYRVTFTRVMISDWIRCPNCHAKSFMNRLLKGKLEIKCRRCKTITDYEFK